MHKLLTTKDFADAIGVSESSLRRWTDSGAIRTARTPGGHRRIALSEAIRFIREHRAAVVRPELLGLPDVPLAVEAEGGGEVAEALHAALLAGDAPRARGQVVSMYLGGMSVAAIADGPVRLALQRIGELWQHAPGGILVEHLAMDICIGAVSAIRQMLPEAAADAPLAVGGAPEGDPYLLASALAAAVLAEAGWRESNFGPQVPLDVLADAARERGAGLVWLSISFVPDAAVLRRGVKKLAERLSGAGVPLVMGGRYAAEVAPPAHGHLMQTMAELSAFARGAMKQIGRTDRG